MATRYWVGGSGNWDATSTANWSTSSGGASGASAPTSADDVIFDAGSNVGTGTFTVTVTGTSVAPAVCENFSTGGAGGALDGAMTLSMGATAQLDVFGSLTLPATNLTWTGTAGATIIFKATTTGKTITTNGVILTTTNITLNGVGGEWTLGSALLTGFSTFSVLAGTFNTANYSMGGNFVSSGTATRAINFGSSSLSTGGASGYQFSGSGLTLNAGTSTITLSSASPTFAGNGLTFYNLSFTSAASGTVTITGANTYNNLTFTSRSATGIRAVNISDNQTVSGTLTLGAANTAIRRVQVVSNTIGTQRTITLNGTLATLADVDLRDIATAGTVGTWTGTRLGNGLNNSGITFDAGVDKYWNLAAGGQWAATAWALSSGGAVSVNNFPLAQDNCIIENTGLNTSATISLESWWVGTINASSRSNAWTFSMSVTTFLPQIYKNLTLSSATTLTGAGIFAITGQGTTQTITSAGVTFTQSFQITIPTGTLVLADNVTTTSATAVNLTAGTLDLSNNTLTCLTFASSNSNTRAIAFGTGKIILTGNNATIWTTSTSTNLTVTGTPYVESNYSGSTGTRTILTASIANGGSESTSFDFYITAGSDTCSGIASSARSINCTGFTGTWINVAKTIYGNLTFSSSMTLGSGTTGTTFGNTSGIAVIKTNGQTLDFPIAQNGAGGTLQLFDNLTLGSTRTFTLTAGTLDVNSKILSTGSFSSSNSNTRTLNLGTGGNITVTGSGATAFNAGTSTNLTLSGTGTVSMTSASAKTFAGGSKVYPYTLNQGGAGALTITGANQFANISNTVQPATITFPASTTTSVQNFTVSGTSGNLVTLNSSTPGTQFTLAKV